MKRSTKPGFPRAVLGLSLLGGMLLFGCRGDSERPRPESAGTEACGECAGEAGCEAGQDAVREAGLTSALGSAHASSEEAGQEAPHDHGEAESSDLDRPVKELLGARCEHDVPTYTCDECRYEVGVVKVVADLLDADGPLDTVRVSRHALAEASGYNGEVRLDEERSAYLSPRAAGAVRSILVDLGASVRRGQVLFTVDSPEFAEARTTFIRARASQRVAHATLEREQDLYEKKVCPRKDLLEAEASHEEAEAELRAARERLLSCGLTSAEIERVGLDEERGAAQLPVTAPFDGTVLERNLGLGATVEPGQPLLLLADTRRMWVLLSLYEREMAAVLEQKERGEVRADVSVSAYPGRAFSGRVDRAGGTMDESTRTVKVRVVVENPDGLLRAGMFARVRLQAGEQAGLALPQEAVLSDEGRSFVFVPAADSYYIRRPVQTGRAWDGWIEITQGLQAGETVVTQGAFLLKSDVLRSKMGAGCAD